MQKLTDDSLMPFGKNKGLPMLKIPAKYLHWYWTQPGVSEDRVCPVAQYIRDNVDALKKEYEDGIW